MAIELRLGDITKIPVDAIVNAANSGLRGGGGVDGAIHRAGGPSIMQELLAYKGCPTGNAVATGAGRLPAKYVFHAVGPVYRGGASGEPELLASAYQTCLRLGEERNVQSISFPSISTGIFGYPVDDAARIAISVTKNTTIPTVLFVLFDKGTFKAYATALE
jgi:O-acetyl-ADP-ribose deacetylase (regulator of RNase III)